MFNITVVNLNHHPKNSQKVNPVWNQRPMNQCSGFLQVSPPNVTSCSKASGSTAATPQPWSDHRFGAVTRIFIYSAIFAAIHPSIHPSIPPSIHPSTCLSMYIYIWNHIKRCGPKIETIAPNRWGPDRSKEISSVASQKISDLRIAVMASFPWKPELLLGFSVITMWVKQGHKPSPSHHHFYRWLNQSQVPNGLFMALFSHINVLKGV